MSGYAPERTRGLAPIDTSAMSLRRSPLAITISASVHVCALAAIVWMSSLAPVRMPRTGTPASLIYNVFIPPPAPPVVLKAPVERPKLPPPPPKVATPEELPKVAVAAPPPPEIHRADPPPPPRETPPLEPAARPEPPKAPAVRPLAVGTFDQTTTTVRSVEPPRQVQTAGFDTAPSRSPEAKLSAATVGAFDSTTGSSTPQPGGQRAARVVASAGFNTDAPPGQLQRQALDVVRDTGFDAAPTPKQAAPRRQDPIEVPLEVLFKPTPSYSAEARALKIEGEVALEVEFLASTKVRVLRVVRGLGHGLDEAAVQAAEQIRFKPAQSGGRAVDVRTTVHIVFKLA